MIADFPRDKNVSECLSAAMNVALIVDELHESKQVFRGFWVSEFFHYNLSSYKTRYWTLFRLAIYKCTQLKAMMMLRPRMPLPDPSIHCSSPLGGTSFSPFLCARVSLRCLLLLLG